MKRKKSCFLLAQLHKTSGLSWLMASQVSKTSFKSGMSRICQLLFVKAFQSWPHLLSSTASLYLKFSWGVLFGQNAVQWENADRGAGSLQMQTCHTLFIIKSLYMFCFFCKILLSLPLNELLLTHSWGRKTTSMCACTVKCAKITTQLVKYVKGILSEDLLACWCDCL